MRSIHLAGAGLGLVAAVVFASAATGPLFVRFLLLFIAPLAIALAGLGWGWRSALLAGGVGAFLIFLLGGPAAGTIFFVTQAAPMVVLTYLAMLSRPAAEGADARSPSGAGDDVEWYPVGRLVLWAAAMSGALAIGTLFLLGGDLDTLRKSLSEFLQNAITASLPQGGAQPGFSEAEMAALSEIALNVLPAASALSWMVSLIFNLWLAGRVTRASGQLLRPWPDLALISYPAGTPLAFGVALFATLLTGYAGLAAAAFAGGLFAAYVLVGLGVIHYATRGQSWRPFMLWALYVSLPLSQFLSAIALSVLGLADSVLRIRARVRPPPGSPPSSHHT